MYLLDALQPHPLGLAEVGQQGPQGGHRRRHLHKAQAGEVFCLKLPQNLQLGRRGGKQLLRQDIRRAAELFLHKGGNFRLVQQPLVKDHLPGGELPQLPQHRPAVPARELGDVHLPGGNVRKGEAAALLLPADAAKIVVAPLLQKGGINEGAGGHHPGNFPLHQPLCQGWVFHLLADGYLVSPFNEAVDVAFGAVVGDAAHRRPLRKAALPAGEGQLQLLGNQKGILEEHLVEIPQPEEENLVPVLLLHLQILPHHGGKFIHLFLCQHGVTPFPGRVWAFCQWQPLQPEQSPPQAVSSWMVAGSSPLAL